MTRDTDPDPRPSAAGPSQPAGPHGEELPRAPQVSRRRIVRILVALAACLVVAFFAGYLPYRTAQRRAEQAARPMRVELLRLPVIRPKRAQTATRLVLPGSIQALHETLLYPQANGYIGDFVVDIGDRVKEGQPLAIIETPALDQELDQARAAVLQAQAALGQAKANRDYAGVTLERYAALRPAGVASQQELDQHRAEALVSEANVAAAEAARAAQEANLRRLHRLKAFARVTAPFAGTITARFIDRGTLVTPGSTTPLFRLVANDPVRVFVQVPQDAAPSVQVGASASLSLREYAGRTFTGVIRRTAGALDQNTRTLNTEVRVPNPKNELLAGMYTNVSLSLSTPRVVYEIPGTALYNDAHGLRVAVLDAESKVHFVAVSVERDLGPSLLIASGLRGDERLLRLANPLLKEGMRVRGEEQQL